MRRAVVLLSAALAVLCAARAPGVTAAMRIPRDFALERSFLGAALYSRDRDGRHEYVQVVDLRLGASVEPLRGPVVDPGTGLGAHGGDNPTFLRRTLGDFWGDFRAGAHRNPFSVSTGTFFDLAQDPAAPLRLPLKDGGSLITDGYDADAFDGTKAMLAVADAWAEIVPLTPEALGGTAAGKVVPGLAVPADAPPGRRTRRSLAGVRDPDGDGVAEVVLLYTGTGVRLDEAVETLERFGATAVLDLNGPASTQLLAKGRTYVAPRRSLPQALAVRAAARTPGGGYAVRHRIVRAGDCSFGGADDTTLVGTETLRRRRRGFRFEPTLGAEIAVTWAGADRGRVRVRQYVICSGGPEEHTATSRASFVGEVIRIAPYRITWCEQMNCVFRESWVLEPSGAGLAPAAGPGAAGLECAGAGCGAGGAP